MAKRTATVEVLDGEEPQITSDPLEGIDSISTEEANQAFAITDELRGTAGITLQFTRVWPNTPGVVGHCGEMAAEEYSLAEASRRYGPGRYVVRLRGPDNRYMRGGGKLNLAGNPGASAGPAQTAPGSSDMVQLLEAMNRRQEDRERADAARSEKFWALALAAIPTIPAIIGAMKGGGGDSTAALISALKPPPAPSMAEIVTTLQGLKSLSGDSDKPDPLEQLGKLMGIAKEMSGGGDDSAGGSNWIDLVRDGLKAAPDLLGAIQTRGPQTVTVQTQPVQPVAQPTPQLQAQAASPQGEQDMWLLIQPVLRDAAQKIEKWAKDNRNPASYADVLYDDLPAWLISQLKPEQALELLNHPQWWEHLTAFHAPLAAFRPWIEQLRGELIEIVSEQIETQKQDGANNT
jgi:hypothetical protein